MIVISSPYEIETTNDDYLFPWSSGRGPNRGGLESRIVDLLLVWPAMMSVANPFPRPNGTLAPARFGSSFSLAVRWNRFLGRPSAVIEC